jgi:RNA polymerase sigma factor (sigma-70 family)
MTASRSCPVHWLQHRTTVVVTDTNLLPAQPYISLSAVLNDLLGNRRNNFVRMPVAEACWIVDADEFLCNKGDAVWMKLALCKEHLMSAYLVFDRTKQAQAGVSTTELVHAAVSGDQEAWEAIVARYAGLLWSVVRSYRVDETEAADVVQTTWLRLVQHLERIREPETLGAWLATTAHRESLRVPRLADRQRPTCDGDTLEAAEGRENGPEARALATEVNRVLWRCMGELPAHCQRILRMLTADPPIAYKQISATLNIPIGSIGPTRGRCLQRLRQLVERAELLTE